MTKMKTMRAYFLLLCIGIQGISHAQRLSSGSGPETPMTVGSLLINLGVGVGANYKGNNYGTGFGMKASAEWGLWEAGPGVISLGPEIGGSFSNGSYYYGGTNYNGAKSNTFVIAGRSAWHYNWGVSSLDTYGGFSAGVGFHHYEDHSGSYDQVIPAFGAFIGGSYFVTPGFGFNAEAGFDITNFQAGVVFKIQ